MESMPTAGLRVSAGISRTPRKPVCWHLLSLLFVIATSPHCHTLGSGLNKETIDNRLSLAFKSTSTTNWHPHPAVTKFLTMKDRRKTMPDVKTYKNREYDKQFFD